MGQAKVSRREYRIRLAAVRRKRKEVARSLGIEADMVSLTTEQLTEALGDTLGLKYRAPGPAFVYRPHCTERVAAVAAGMAEPGRKLSAAAVAEEIGVSPAAAERAVKHLKAEGRWPYLPGRPARTPDATKPRTYMETNP